MEAISEVKSEIIRVISAQEDITDAEIIEGILSDSEDIDAEKVSNNGSLDITPTSYTNLTNIDSFLREAFKLQNIWIASHAMTLLGTSLYIFGQFKPDTVLKTKAYKISTLSSLFTYLIVLKRTADDEEIVFDESNKKVEVKKKLFSLTNLLKNENAHLLGYILLWNFTSDSLLKLIPFLIYSFLNISSFFVLDLFPQNPLSIAVSPLLNLVEFPLLVITSYIDLFVFGILIKETFPNRNVYPLVIYFFIWVLRFENSEASRSSIGLIISFLDNHVFNSPFISDSAKETWKELREILQIYFPIENKQSQFQDAEESLLDDE